MSSSASRGQRRRSPFERVRLTFSPLVLLAGAAACAHGMREPRPLAPAGAPPPPPAASAAQLLREAEASFARRPDVDAVRKADTLFIEAAQADEKDVAGLIGSIRAKMWLVDHDKDAKSRASLTSTAVDAGQWCGRRAPGDPRCDYWLALALGVQAREERSLSSVKTMIDHLRRASASDPRLDFAGPERVLALVLVKAPGWPIGPGDAEEGLKEARRAVALFPEYPPNQLALAETLKANGSADEARAAAVRALELAEARAATGDPDAADWAKDARKLVEAPRS